MNNLPKIGVPLLIALTFGLLLVAKSIVTIGSGEAGVEYRLCLLYTSDAADE